MSMLNTHVSTPQGMSRNDVYHYSIFRRDGRPIYKYSQEHCVDRHSLLWPGPTPQWVTVQGPFTLLPILIVIIYPVRWLKIRLFSSCILSCPQQRFPKDEIQRPKGETDPGRTLWSPSSLERKLSIWDCWRASPRLLFSLCTRGMEKAMTDPWRSEMGRRCFVV